MVKNILKSKEHILGILLSISLLIPPNFGLNFNGINLEDIPLFVTLLFLIYENVNKKYYQQKSQFDMFFYIFFVIFVIYTTFLSSQNFETFNKINIRFYAYILFGFLIVKNKYIDTIKIFEPLFLVMIVNFFIVVFQISMSGDLVGWISNNTSSSNFFTSGRLGGIQGSGPNVIGFFCALTGVIYINKYLEEIINKKYLNIYLPIVFVSVFNLFFTYSRGSYLIFIFGSILVFISKDKITKKLKIYGLLFSTLSLVIITIFNSSVLLKQSNRSFLNEIGINNVQLFSGTGGGNYVKEVYKDYLITLDADILKSELNIEYDENEINYKNNNYVKSEFPKGEGYLKLKFDYYDNFLPRSAIGFYFSNDGESWEQLGFDHTNGSIINLIENDSFFEVGGWGDGQSTDESYLEGFVKQIQIGVDERRVNFNFLEENRNIEYFIFSPKNINLYENINDGKIIFDEKGIKLERPRSYWIGLPNDLNLSKKDFEIIMKIELEKIPRYSQTLFSQSSILKINDEFNDQSWKWVLSDGHMYFFWIENVDNGYADFLGGKSLRSSKLITENGKFASLDLPSLDTSQFDELTTAHNGFLTMSVEYGAFLVGLILIVIFIGILKNYKSEARLEVILLLLFLTQNLTNDLIYSPDAGMYFWIMPLFLFSNFLKNR